MSVEWEDFSKSLESDYHSENRNTSTPRGKPVAPVAPQKPNESYNAWYENSSSSKKPRVSTYILLSTLLYIKCKSC